MLGSASGLKRSGFKRSSLSQMHMSGLEDMLSNPVGFYESASAFLVATVSEKLPEFATAFDSFTLSLPTVEIPTIDTDALSDELKANLDTLSETSGVALNKASQTFSGQLAEKGGVLSGNLASYGAATSGAFNEIADGIKKVDPKVVDKLVDNSLNDLKASTENLGAAFAKAGEKVASSKLAQRFESVGSNLAAAASATNTAINTIGDIANEISKVDPQTLVDPKTITLPPLPLPDQDTANAAVKDFFKSVQNDGNKLLDKVQTWRLFPEDNWEKGVWEQQIKAVAEKANEIDVKELQNSINKVAAQVDTLIPKSM